MLRFEIEFWRVLRSGSGVCDRVEVGGLDVEDVLWSEIGFERLKSPMVGRCFLVVGYECLDDLRSACLWDFYQRGVWSGRLDFKTQYICCLFLA